MATIENTATEERLIDVLHSIAKERTSRSRCCSKPSSGPAHGVQTAFWKRVERDRDRRPADRRLSGISIGETSWKRWKIPSWRFPSTRPASRTRSATTSIQEVTPKDFGRIAAQTAKQVIVQRIREAERDTVYNKYVRKLNDLLPGPFNATNSAICTSRSRGATKPSCISTNKYRARRTGSTISFVPTCST